ncbi:MAG: hypothetical protein IJA87_04150 [Clostridia bacterium]|nr:hypothetical protein [Clostridia bacterium]
MKNSVKSVISFILASVMLFSMGTSAFATDAQPADNTGIIIATNLVNSLLNGVFSLLSSLFPTSSIPTAEDYFDGESENFYEGTEDFIDSPADGAKWSLGFDDESIVPENLADGSKKYYTGGYFTQKIDSVYDDQKVHAIALSDGSGRGTAIFATIDGIGVGNADIRAIRARAEEKIKAEGIKSDIVAININSTHCHTVVDTQGMSLMLIPQIFINIAANIPFLKPIRSIDREFHEIMIDGAAEAIANSYMNMEDGSLYYYETERIARDDEKGIYQDDEYAYLRNKRYDTEGYQNFFACFKFVPDNTDSRSTVFTNIGAHPTTIDRATSKLSADFPAYMEKKINESGSNFMFIQGAQSPVSVRKDGVQDEGVLNEVNAEIEADPSVEDYRAAKTLGYEFARLIIEGEENAAEVAPLLNVRMSEIKVNLDIGLLQLGATSQLLGFTTVKDSESQSGYSIITEVGYIELGTDIVMLTVPGELVPQLVYGNVVDKTEAYLGKDWEIECTADIIGKDKTVLVMGLCNDAIGYIVPDNDYAPFIADSLWNTEMGEKLWGEYHRHYEEMLSAGSTAASSVMTALNSLTKDAK